MSSKNEKRGKMRLRWFKTKVKFFVVMVVIAQITTSVLKGFHSLEFRWITLTVYCVLFGILVIVTLEYMIYGWFLYRCITDQEETIRSHVDKLKGAQSGVVAAAIMGPNKSDHELENSKKFSSSNRIDEKDGSANPDESQRESQPIQHPESPNFYGAEEGSQFTEDLVNRHTVDRLKPRILKGSEQDLVIDGFDHIAHQEDHSIEIVDFPKVTKIASAPHHWKSKSHKNLTVLSKNTVSSATIKLSKSVRRKGSLGFEKQVKEIVQRDKAFLKSVEILDPKYENLASEISVIIDDGDDVIWDFVDEADIKKQEDEMRRKKDRKEETKRAVAEIRENPLVVDCMAGKKENLLHNVFQTKLLRDRDYLKIQQETTSGDELIIKKILSLTIIAISLEVLFGIMSFLVFWTPVLQTPVGMIVSMWISGFLEVFAIVAIIFLFSIVHTQEKENLRLIMRIGQTKNRINRLYAFVLPKRLRHEETKKKLVKSINLMTAKYMKKKTGIYPKKK